MFYPLLNVELQYFGKHVEFCVLGTWSDLVCAYFWARRKYVFGTEGYDGAQLSKVQGYGGHGDPVGPEVAS